MGSALLGISASATEQAGEQFRILHKEVFVILTSYLIFLE
jgi:hypothetical protein